MTKEVFVGSASYLQNALWFLPALFVVNLLLSFLIKFSKKEMVIMALAGAFCLVLLYSDIIQTKHYCIPYGIDVAIYLTPFLIILRYAYFNRVQLSTYNPLLFAGGFIISSVLIHFIIPKRPANVFSGRFDLAQFYVPDTLWGYLLICSLSVFIFLLFLNFNKSSIFSKIGVYTLPIFILHTYPWFGGLENLRPGWFLPVNVAGNIIIGICISKLLMKISPKFSWIGMVA